MRALLGSAPAPRVLESTEGLEHAICDRVGHVEVQALHLAGVVVRKMMNAQPIHPWDFPNPVPIRQVVGEMQEFVIQKVRKARQKQKKSYVSGNVKTREESRGQRESSHEKKERRGGEKRDEKIPVAFRSHRFMREESVMLARMDLEHQLGSLEPVMEGAAMPPVFN